MWLSNIHKYEIDREDYKAWLNGKTIGPPKATAHYSIKELKKWGMVGVYGDQPATTTDSSNKIKDGES